MKENWLVWMSKPGTHSQVMLGKLMFVVYCVIFGVIIFLFCMRVFVFVRVLFETSHLNIQLVSSVSVSVCLSLSLLFPLLTQTTNRYGVSKIPAYYFVST